MSRDPPRGRPGGTGDAGSQDRLDGPGTLEEEGALPSATGLERPQERSRALGSRSGPGTLEDSHPPSPQREGTGGEHPKSHWPQGKCLEAPVISYAPPQNPTKHWPTEAPMERWFAPESAEHIGSNTAARHVNRCAESSRTPVRDPLPHVGADVGPGISGDQERWSCDPSLW